MKPKKDVILFGASELGKKVHDIFKITDEYNVLAFVDNSKQKQGSSFCGLPVISAEEAVSRGACIIITSMYLNEITEQLDNLGFQNYQSNIQYILENFDSISFQSANYWETRYKQGENSGAGSYGRLAQFKADVINEFVEANKVSSVIELGCGDGNQLSLMKYQKYIGFDVSKTAIGICKEKFMSDASKDFVLYDPITFTNNAGVIKADLTLSLDVIYHLTEDSVYENYMRNLFDMSNKYVIIYSSNFELNRTGHERRRKFTDWIDGNRSSFELIKFIPNKYPIKEFGQETTDESASDFFIYKFMA